MARARNLKPGLFKNDELAETGPLGMLLFAGLWTVADRAGRLEDRPLRIKAEVLPYFDADVDGLLGELDQRGFLKRYEAGGLRLIQVQNFDKHQTPHPKEPASNLPAYDLTPASHGQDSEEPLAKNASSLRSYVLTPDVLIPDTGGCGGDGEPEADDDAADAAQPKTQETVRPVPKPRAIRIPDDFALTDDLRSWAIGAGLPPPAVDREFERFRDYYGSKTERRTDWVAVWRNWVRKAIDMAGQRSPNGRVSPAQSKAERDMAMLEAIATGGHW